MSTGLKREILNLKMTIVFVFNRKESVPLMEIISLEEHRANQNLNASCNVQFCMSVNITPGLVRKTKTFTKNIFYFLHAIL